MGNRLLGFSRGGPRVPKRNNRFLPRVLFLLCPHDTPESAPWLLPRGTQGTKTKQPVPPQGALFAPLSLARVTQGTNYEFGNASTALSIPVPVRTGCSEAINRLRSADTPL